MTIISLSTLQKKGIKIEEDSRRITPLPQYAEDLRQLLLNFKAIIPLYRKTDLEQLYETDERLLNKKFRSKKAIYCDSRHRTYEARWEAACELRNKAMHLPDRERESAWNGLMTNFVFQGVTYQASDEGILLRDKLSWGSDELFTNAVSIRGRFSDGNDYQPKPDFWFGLGLYDDRQLSLLEGLELKDKGIEYFTQEKLEAIRPIHNENLIYQPVGSRKYAAFPWMVVELKAEFRSERECIRQEKECIRQAANASHASLVLCKRLAKPAAIDASPIVAFTSVGPEVKVFIAYKSKEDGEDEVYYMSCIWSDNIEHILHALQLRRIIDQLIHWALGFFKPWVTGCLEHWYTRGTDDDTDEETEDEAEEETDDET